MTQELTIVSKKTQAKATNGNESTDTVKGCGMSWGTDTTCLCSFNAQIPIEPDQAWVSVPLKQCVMALCASCPDMLMAEVDCALYSINHPASRENGVIWEGHGLLSWILDSNRPSVVSGRVQRREGDTTMTYVEVTLQLHRTQRISQSAYYETLMHPPASTPSSYGEDHRHSPTERSRAPTEPMGHTTGRSSGPLHFTDSTELPRLSMISSQSTPVLAHQMNASHGGAPRSLSPGSSGRLLPPITSSVHPSEHESKKRKLSPPLPVSAAGTMMPRSRTSPQLHLPPPSALLDLAQQDQLPSHHQQRHHPYYSSAQHMSDASLSPSTPSPPFYQTTPASCPLTNTPSPSAPLLMPSTKAAVGRRKKRDTKPPNANDVRTFVEVEKDEKGNYRLPVEIDSWMVYNLGTVVYDRPAFHNQRYIYPVGYKVKKWYRSMVNPRSDTQYLCEILDGGQEPVFRLEADDNPGEVYTGPTPTTVWTIVVRRAFAIRNMEYGHNPVGPDFFGLRKNTIAKMIQDLPNADQCKNYIWQTFKTGTTGRTARAKPNRFDYAEPSTPSA